jgi:hypothetical protein
LVKGLAGGERRDSGQEEVGEKSYSPHPTFYIPGKKNRPRVINPAVMDLLPSFGCERSVEQCPALFGFAFPPWKHMETLFWSYIRCNKNYQAQSLAAIASLVAQVT